MQTKTFQPQTRQWDGRIRYAGESAANQFGVFTVEGASRRQAGYLRHLLASRVLPAGFQVPANVEALSKDSTSALIDLLAGQPLRDAVAPKTTGTPTRRANRFAGRCVKCGGRVEAEAGYLAKDADGRWAAEHVTCPAADAPVDNTVGGELTPGVYKVDGQVYIVKPNQAKTRLYAKRLVELRDTQGDRLAEDGKHVRIEFEYAPGAVFQIRPEHRMPLEEGKALTVRYGKCICCSRKLEVAESVERGMGKVCAKYFG